MRANHRTAWARGSALLAVAAAALAFSGGASAGGTPADTNITNKATLNYSVGGVAQPAIASSPTGSSNATGADTAFRVDNKIVHTVATTDGAPVSVVPGQTNVDLTFTVTNNGNATQDYALAVADLANGAQTIFGGPLTDTFNPTGCVTRIGGVNQSYVGNLAADASATVVVRCSIPATQVNNDLAGIALTASAAQAGSNGATLVTQTAGADTPNTVDIVFADTAGSDDPARNGDHSARSAFRVVSASLTVTKTAAVRCDPFNGGAAGANPKNIPGAYVRYTITIANGGGASAMLTTMTDALNANVDFDPHLILGNGAAATCVLATATPTNAENDGFRLVYAARGAAYNPKFMTTGANGDGAQHVGGTVTLDFVNALPAGGAYAAGELKAGESLTVEYQVRIK